MPQLGNNNNNNNEIKTEDIVVQNPVVEEADQEVGEAGQGPGKVDPEVGEAGQEANKAEQEDNQVDQDNPVIEDENEFYEEGHFLAPEEKTKLVDYTKIFEDQKKFAAMADDAKVALFKEYALLKAKSATYYRPSKEQQMLQELESSRKIVDKTFDLMVKNVKVGTNCLEELNQVYIMELCFGNTLLGRSDEEKEAILEEYEKERIESWRKREEKKRKREEEKKKAAEKASVGLIPQQRKIEPEQEQPKEEEKAPEKKEEQTREADNDPEDIGRKKFTIDDANKEGEEFYNGIKSVDFNLLGKGSPQFRAMKDSLKALSSRAKIDYHLNDGKLNLGAYCMAQEDAIKKMEDYLAYKEDQFDKDPDRKEDPARQKREQPRIQKTIQILSKLKKS